MVVILLTVITVHGTLRFRVPTSQSLKMQDEASLFVFYLVYLLPFVFFFLLGFLGSSPSLLLFFEVAASLLSFLVTAGLLLEI